MLSLKDFEKKQMIVAFFNEGDKLAFSNDNLIIKNEDEIKLQVTCYRVFIVYIIGNCSITSVILQNAKKYNFRVVVMSPSCKVIDILGYQKDGNTLLKNKQYNYSGLEIAKHIISNKMLNQLALVKDIRKKTDYDKEVINSIRIFINDLKTSNSINTIMAYEGNVSKLFFSSYYQELEWKSRKPRTKFDYINSLLDLGYSMLFNFIDSLLNCFGFDTYVGVLHTRFYMRKSLTCDIIEPFRCIIDRLVRKSINLKQFKKEDFEVMQNEYILKYSIRSQYVTIIMKEILKYKNDIFVYIKYYYRAFMKNKNFDDYPYFLIGDDVV